MQLVSGKQPISLSQENILKLRTDRIIPRCAREVPKFSRLYLAQGNSRSTMVEYIVYNSYG